MKNNSGFIITIGRMSSSSGLAQDFGHTQKLSTYQIKIEREGEKDETGASGESKRRERENLLSWWCIVKIDFSHICSKRY